MKVLLPHFIFKNDARLASDIHLTDELDKTIPDKAKKILLTGATGFLGSFLLKSLFEKTTAEIYCLIRAKDGESAEKRLVSSIKSYLGQDFHWNNRIIPMQGDLEQPKLGLTDKAYDNLSAGIDAIFHNGALVNYAYPYPSLKKANVTSTEEILRLAVNKKLKHVHYISTLFVFSENDFAGEPVIYEKDEPVHCEDIRLGYGQSKWVGDTMIRNASRAGIPASVYRVGRVSGDTNSGICQTSDLFWNIMQKSIQVKSYPDLQMEINLCPVDLVSAAIVEIASRKNTEENIFHILNATSSNASELFETVKGIGYHMEELPIDQWKEKVSNYAEKSGDTSASTLVHVINQLNLDNANRKFDMSNTLTNMKETTLACQITDRRIMDKYVRHFVDVDFIPPPLGIKKKSYCN